MLAVVALLQRLSDTSILFAQPGGRAYATLGNPIYLGNVMAVSIFLSAYLFVKERVARFGYVVGGFLMFWVRRYLFFLILSLFLL